MGKKKLKSKRRCNAKQQQRRAPRRPTTAATSQERKSSSPKWWVGAIVKWIGIGVAVLATLDGSQTILDYSPWATWIIKNWSHYVQVFWSFAFGIVGFRVFDGAEIVWTFYLGLLLAGFAAATLQGKLNAAEPTTETTSVTRSFFQHIGSTDSALRMSSAFLVSSLTCIGFLHFGTVGLFGSPMATEDLTFSWLPVAIYLLGVSGAILLLTAGAYRDFGHSLMLAGSLSCFYVLLFISTVQEAGSISAHVYGKLNLCLSI